MPGQAAPLHGLFVAGADATLIRMAQDPASRSGSPDERPELAEGRPPGELGGHTVQPWEQDAVPPTTSPNSKDVPPPEMGTAEARAAGPGPGAKTTAAPGNQPSGATAGHGRSIQAQRPAAEAKTPELPGSEGAEEPGAATAAPSQVRPPRPPVYKPQNGHEPAPRPPPAQVAQAKAKGPATEGDALVEAITKAIAENLAKALHQSIAQAVRDLMPLSGRTIAQPKVDVAPQLRKAPPKPAARPPAQPAAAPGQEAKPAPATDPSPPTPPGNQPQPSQYGGVIEAPDEAAKARAAATASPSDPAIGKPAADAADRETGEGNLS